MITELKKEILNWDGKSVDVLDGIYECYCHESRFISYLLQATEPVDTQKASTWLLKKFFEKGNKLRAGDTHKLYSLLPKLDHWETKLHVLQCIPFTVIATSQSKQVELFLRQCLNEPNKFVRAWAYNGFYELSLQYPCYQEEVKILLAEAMEDEAASVRARIRGIIKKGFF